MHPAASSSRPALCAVCETREATHRLSVPTDASAEVGTPYCMPCMGSSAADFERIPTAMHLAPSHLSHLVKMTDAHLRDYDAQLSEIDDPNTFVQEMREAIRRELLGRTGDLPARLGFDDGTVTRGPAPRPAVIRNPRFHLLDSDDPYGDTQTNDMRDGDVFKVAGTNVVGMLVSAWPVFISGDRELAESMGIMPLAADADIACLGQTRWGREMMLTIHPHEGEPYRTLDVSPIRGGADYTASIVLAAEVADSEVCAPGDLRVGDIVREHGMVLLVDRAPQLSKSHARRYGTVYFAQTLVLNRAQVPNDWVPYSFTERTPEGDRCQGMLPENRVTRREHRWNLQGNDLARVCRIIR